MKTNKLGTICGVALSPHEDAEVKNLAAKAPLIFDCGWSAGVDHEQ